MIRGNGIGSSFGEFLAHDNIMYVGTYIPTQSSFDKWIRWVAKCFSESGIPLTFRGGFTDATFPRLRYF